MKVRSSVFASFILIFEVIGVALFLRGFFPVPVKSSFSSKSKLADQPAEPLTGGLASAHQLLALVFTRLSSCIWSCEKHSNWTNDAFDFQGAPTTPPGLPSPSSSGWSSCWWTLCGRTLCLDPMGGSTCRTPDTWWRGAPHTVSWPKPELPQSPCPGLR